MQPTTDTLVLRFNMASAKVQTSNFPPALATPSVALEALHKMETEPMVSRKSIVSASTSWREREMTAFPTMLTRLEAEIESLKQK